MSVDNITSRISELSLQDIPSRFLNTRVFCYKLSLLEGSELLETKPSDIEKVIGPGNLRKIDPLSQKQKPLHLMHIDLTTMSPLDIVNYELEYEGTALRLYNEALSTIEDDIEFLERVLESYEPKSTYFDKGFPKLVTSREKEQASLRAFREIMPFFYSNEIERVQKELELWDSLRKVELYADFGYNPFDESNDKSDAILAVELGRLKKMLGYGRRVRHTLESIANHDPEVKDIAQYVLRDW